MARGPRFHGTNYVSLLLYEGSQQPRGPETAPLVSD